MPSFATSWEGLLVFLVIVLLSGLSNWLKQRQARREQAESQARARTTRGESAAPPPLASPREPEGADWERELRRLFGEEPEPPPLPPPLPPPRPTPAVLPEPAPPETFQPPRLEPEAPYEPVAPPLGTRLAPTAELESRQVPASELASLAEAMAALNRASHPQEDAIARLSASAFAPRRALSASLAPERVVSPEIARVRAQLRQPQTAREVILATVLLGPPRALDPSPLKPITY